MSQAQAALRVVSPCEHGITHHIIEAPDGCAFAVPECRTKAGIPRTHQATGDKYPRLVGRR